MDPPLTCWHGGPEVEGQEFLDVILLLLIRVAFHQVLIVITEPGNRMPWTCGVQGGKLSPHCVI